MGILTMDIANLTKMMGHSSKATTLDIYGDDNPNAMKESIGRLALLFDDKTDTPNTDETAEKLYKIEQKLKEE
jgi:hypothetical protein